MGIGGASIDRGRLGGAEVGAVLAVLVVSPPLVLVTAARPLWGVLCAQVLTLAAVAALNRTVGRVALGVLAALLTVVLLVLVALAPGLAVWAALAAALVAAAAGVLAPRARAPGLPPTGARGVPWIAIAALVLAPPVCVALALGLALWPATALLILVVAAVVALARLAPAAALVAAVLMMGFEGSIKIVLGLEGTPLPGGNRAVGAFAIDVALLAAVAGVVLADRIQTPRRLWAAATRVERAAIALFGAWLALSVAQIAQGGNLVRGLHGFRLFQAYTVLALAAAIVVARPQLRARAGRALLAVGLVVAGYAALRVIVGPAGAEADFARSAPTVVSYGGALRAIGSFSSAIGLSSYLAPLAVFALVVGYLDVRLRRLGWVVAACSIVGLIGSYSRASLFGVALGLVCAVVLLGATADVPRRRKLVAAAMVVGVLFATYGGVEVASRASPRLRERASGMLHPFSDTSMQLRAKTWRRTLRKVADEPLGHGLGAAGAASSPDRRQVVTTDNSFLKVLLEQGVPGGVLFVGSLLALVVVFARRLRGAVGDARTLGLAALAGFVTFIGISATGETVEQPGKVIAWVLLGIAAATALGTPLRGSRRR